MRVLIAEDDLTSRGVLRRILTKWGYEVVVTSDGHEAWAECQREDSPRLLILDWMMPGLDGVEVCQRVRAVTTSSPPYIILLTAREGRKDIVTGLEAGANDYLGKPFDHDELRARVDVGRRFVELNQQLLETQRTLELQARTDALTGSMNRRAILERLGQEMARAERQGTTFGVGMMDIDLFKRINDTYGHGAGDDVLCEVVARSTLAMRPYDAFGRFGGEEFLAIIPGASSSEVHRVFERIREAICASPVKVDESEIKVSVSIGGATSGGESIDAVVRAADDALYQAKANGRNQVVMAHGPYQASARSGEDGPGEAGSE
jgi:two-component system, cell cycle response regulator